MTCDNSLRERLLRECDLTLPKAIAAGHAAEETRKHAREILKSNEPAALHKISKHKVRKSSSHTLKTPPKDPTIINKCKFCNGSPPRGKCPAYGKICHNCSKKNHFKFCSEQKKLTMKIRLKNTLRR